MKDLLSAESPRDGDGDAGVRDSLIWSDHKFTARDALSKACPRVHCILT